ncbi:MAG: HEAT repeat domain-containing protein [Planctomycetota bacterium]
MRFGFRLTCLFTLFAAAPWLCAGDVVQPRPTLPGFVNMNSAEGRAVSDDMSEKARYDEVVRDLMDQLQNKLAPINNKNASRFQAKPGNDVVNSAAEREQFNSNAQDAALKLAKMGKRAVPELSRLFSETYNKPGKDAAAERAVQLAYYSAWSLAHIRTAEASLALLPLMTNPAAPQDLRLIAVDAFGWEKSAEGVAVLEKAARSDTDIEIRKHALGQLSMMPEQWLKVEPVFIAALSDPNDDIRVQSAKACHYSHMFQKANPKLVELLEKDPVPMVRMYATLTVARMKFQKAQPALVRVLAKTDLDDKSRKNALNAITAISGVPFRGPENVAAWWEKTGRLEFEKNARIEQEADERAADIKANRPIKSAPKSLTDEASTGGIIPAPGNSLVGEIVPLDPEPKEVEPKVVRTEDVPVVSAIVEKTAVIDSPETTLNPKESTGSQRRRLRKND